MTCRSEPPSPMTPDAKNRDAFGVTSVDNGVMTQNEFPERGWAVLDWASDVRELADSPECILEDLAIDCTLAGTPLSLGVIQDVLELTQRTRGNNDLNT